MLKKFGLEHFSVISTSDENVKLLQNEGVGGCKLKIISQLWVKFTTCNRIKTLSKKVL